MGSALTSQKNQPPTSMSDTDCLRINNFWSQEKTDWRERGKKNAHSDVSQNYVSADSVTL